jgi:predicted secreted protein
MQRKTVGLPGFERPGVSDYLIRRIITDGTGKSIVFVIEKKTFDKNGNSIRYMVETLRL